MDLNGGGNVETRANTLNRTVWAQKQIETQEQWDVKLRVWRAEESEIEKTEV